ncbi:MAG TPA: heme o synthase [Thermomicrobiales bacterium]|nr:heme o synthase [Thermomicrobiales bacterium]
MTRLYRLAVLSAVSTYLLIILGGITRVSGSGLGCEDDWPLCQGKPYPPLNTLAIIEYLHRTVAAYIGVLVLAVAIATWVSPATRKRTKLMAAGAFGLVVVQALLGAATVWRELPASIVTAHLGTAMLFFASTLLTAYWIALDRGEPAWLVAAGRDKGLVEDRRFSMIAGAGALVTFLLILSGGATSTSGAALACWEWPTCGGGQIVPDRTSKYTWINLSHRTAAIIGTVTIGIVLYAALRRPVTRAARRLAKGAAAIIGVQVLLGAAYVVSDGSPWLSAAHLGTATLLWATMLGVAVVARRPAEVEWSPVPWRRAALRPAGGAAAESVLRMSPAEVGPGLTVDRSGAVAIATPGLAVRGPDLRRAGEVVSDYVTLMKPGILSLLLATTLGGMLVAAEGLPSLGLVLATMLGGILSAGGANVLNCYIDRDIDQLMHRTKKRGTATGRISPRAALLFGLTLTVASVLVFGLLVNWLAAGLALAGSVYYVLVYTRLLKRRTPQNIVIGGAAGAMPPVVGWAAATGHLSVAAVLLFAIIYYWTPPHFWALALLKQGEYGRAAVPMLPVVAGEGETRRQVLLYSVLLAAVSLLLVAFGLSWIYLVGALALNGIFVGFAVQLYRAPSKRLARQLFFFSLWYLALIFAAMVADRLVLA